MRSNCRGSNVSPPATSTMVGAPSPGRSWVPRCFTTRRYQELLENKDIDCLIAAVPDHWHKQIVIDGVTAGKDVYCEKPMSHTPADGVAMVKEVERTGRIVQIGSQRGQFGSCREGSRIAATRSARRSDNGGGHRSGATTQPALGSTPLPSTCPGILSTGIPGRGRCPAASSILWSSPAGAAGGNTAPESRAICWSTW
jgi:hypothetical protein